MFSMQYGVDLDESAAASIRARMPEIGARFDQLPGLYEKAFLMARAPGAETYRYTPFYLWQELDSMTDFLLSDGFQRVVNAWGRPVVRRWNPVGLVKGSAVRAEPRYAVQQFIDIDRAVEIAPFIVKQQNEAAALTTHANLHTAYVGLDTDSWQLMKISLWTDTPPAELAGRTFDVLYLSAPGLRRESHATDQASHASQAP